MLGNCPLTIPRPEGLTFTHKFGGSLRAEAPGPFYGRGEEEELVYASSPSLCRPSCKKHG